MFFFSHIYSLWLQSTFLMLALAAVVASQPQLTASSLRWDVNLWCSNYVNLKCQCSRHSQSFCVLKWIKKKKKNWSSQPLKYCCANLHSNVVFVSYFSHKHNKAEEERSSMRQTTQQSAERGREGRKGRHRHHNTQVLSACHLHVMSRTVCQDSRSHHQCLCSMKQWPVLLIWWETSWCRSSSVIMELSSAVVFLLGTHCVTVYPPQPLM